MIVRTAIYSMVFQNNTSGTIFAIGEIQIDLILNIIVDEADIINRITGRRVHPASGRTYHVEYNPPKMPEKDDITGDDLIQRDDDTEETVRSGYLFITSKLSL